MRHTNRLAHLLVFPAITLLCVLAGAGCSGESATADVPESGPIVAELVGGFRKTTVTASGDT